MKNTNKQLSRFLEAHGMEYHRERSVTAFTTMRIGGKVGFLIVVRSRVQLEELLSFITQLRFPYVLLGGGSNVVFQDDCPQLAVIVNLTSRMEKISEESLVKINSGVTNSAFLNWAAENRIGGMEFLAGVPGAVGGAAAVNAGAFGVSISSVLEKADIFSPASGKITTVNADYFEFRYRNSRFKYGDEIILDVFLKYSDALGETIRKQVKEKVLYRSQRHPVYGLATAGCFFKNPVIDGQKMSAGKLLEECGFKGRKYDRLEISDSHSNFIINSSGGSFDDIAALEKTITETVSGKTVIQLEREVIYISPTGKKY
ncbi:MAG: UDP-N-acetylmuramate dehydrogenase [bacterium]|nr:UDP-N-acetylmuramate dehydrogenase [bacterium]